LESRYIEDEITIDIREIFTIIRKYIVLILIIPIIAALTAGVTVFFVMDPVYKAETTLLVKNQTAAQLNYNDLLFSRQLVKTYREIARSRVVAIEVISDLNLNMTAVQVQDMVDVTLRGDTEIIAISIGPAKAQAILDWIGRNIRKEPADVFSALDVLTTGRAECQGHAYLFAALARASGIPTRVANGLVYADELKGFAYHAWNESLIDGQWIAIDPMFGQFEADATHFKLLYGENLGDLAPLAAWIGTTRIAVLESR